MYRYYVNKTILYKGECLITEDCLHNQFVCITCLGRGWLFHVLQAFIQRNVRAAGIRSGHEEHDNTKKGSGNDHGRRRDQISQAVRSPEGSTRSDYRIN